MSEFQLTGDKDWKELGNGVKRQIVSYDSNMMLVKVNFEPGAVGALHHHPHVQMSYVESGIFDYTIEGKTLRLSAGESCFIASNKIHGCVCIEAGTLLDVFSPYREDFLE